MIATVHVSSWITIPAALVLLAVLLRSWLRLGRPGIDRRMCRARRVSIAAAMASLPLLVGGLSLADPEVEPARYVLLWSGAVVVLFALLVTACLDAIIVLRCHGEIDLRGLLDEDAAQRAEGGRPPGDAT